MSGSAGKNIPAYVRFSCCKYNLKRRRRNLVKQIWSEPVQACGVFARAVDIVNNDPASAFKPVKSAAMGDAKLTVSIVPGLEAVGKSRSGRAIRAARCLGPVDPKKTSGAAHLVPAIDGDCVMNGGACESIIPRRGAVVEISSGVASQVDSLPP